MTFCKHWPVALSFQERQHHCKWSIANLNSEFNRSVGLHFFGCLLGAQIWNSRNLALTMQGISWHSLLRILSIIMAFRPFIVLFPLKEFPLIKASVRLISLLLRHIKFSLEVLYRLWCLSVTGKPPWSRFVQEKESIRQEKQTRENLSLNAPIGLQEVLAEQSSWSKEPSLNSKKSRGSVQEYREDSSASLLVSPEVDQSFKQTPGHIHDCAPGGFLCHNLQQRWIFS